MKLGGSLERRRRSRSRGTDARSGGSVGTWLARLGLDRRSLAVVGALALAGWIVGYFIATRMVFPAPPPPQDIASVPDLRDLDLATAEERLAGANLQLGAVDSIAHPTAAASRVLGQAPLPGQAALPGTAVDVTFSLGPQTRSVPDVTGLAADQAVILLQASGFTVGTDSIESDEPRGRVIEIVPGPESMVPLPAEVLLTVSSGPPAVLMPLVLGLEEDAARATLEGLGLIVIEIQEVFRFGRDQGVVVEQDPAADTELSPGAEVRLSVGRRGG
jgi:serine/threonine-protein kinase